MKNKAKWYVYKLIDPVTRQVFYVGKGAGNRIDKHESEAAKGVCSHKCNKINSIKQSGFEIIKEKVATFWCEQSAYDFETDLIEEIGLGNLTNVMRGGQVAFVLRLKERKQRAIKNKPAPPLMVTLEECAGRIATLIRYPSRYWYLDSDSEKTKALRKKMADILKTMMPKLLCSCIADNEDKTMQLFADYGINRKEVYEFAYGS